MLYKKTKLILLIHIALATALFISCKPVVEDNAKEVDICIYGGTSAGVIAAYTAKMMGKSVLLIEPRRNLGGMSSGGLGYTDIGNKYVVTGLSRDFYRKIGEHYGKLEQWIFEPSVAERIFNDYAKKADIDIVYENRLKEVDTKDNSIYQITLENTYEPQKENMKIKAKVFIDCSYEGDLMAKSGVSYAIGRESNEKYKETYNGVQLLDGHQFNNNIDPYIIAGNKDSGLLWGINETSLQPNGSADNKIQAYNFRIALTNVKENRIPITKPDNYDPAMFELLVRIKEKEEWKGLNDVFIWSHMPNGKTDINNRGAFSTDMIAANWEYPEASYQRREEIWQAHTDYTKGLLYFVGNDKRVPENIRNMMQEWGYPKDEYPHNNHWSHQLYIRESRRLIGEKIMTQHHCQGHEVINDPIGWAAYTMDSHNCDRQIVDAVVKNEGNVEIGGFDPYPIAYQSITPLKREVRNLLVPVCLSASHIAYGSIRMEPVFMVLAQSAAVAASIAIDDYDCIVQDVAIDKILKELKENPLANKSTPEIIVDDNDKHQVTINGNWTQASRIGYGLTYLRDESKGKEPKSVDYGLAIKMAGKYNAYFYLPKVKDITSQTKLTVFDGRDKIEKVIKTSDVTIIGQTSGEWVSLGQYNFSEGDKSYIQISNEGADGIVVADAILLVPVK